MKSSTIDEKIKYTLCVIFYLLLWQIVSMWIGEEILLVSPIKVLIRLSELVFELEFWENIAFTCFRILSGFALALLSSCITSILSYRFNSFRIIMMAFPILYSALLSGFDNIDEKLIEMGDIFSFSFIKKLKYIYLPSIINSFITSLTTAIGLAWKSGVAAEVIGLPDGSLGERLYEAKTFLMSQDIFAVTLTVIAISIIIEKAISLIVKTLATRSHLI